MPSTALNGLPSPDDESPNLPPIHFDALNAVLDAVLVPHYTTTGARDTAVNAFTAAGGVMKAGMLCTVAGALQRWTGSLWAPTRPQAFTRTHTPVSTFIPSGNFRESGVVDGPPIATFVTYEAVRLVGIATFRAGQDPEGVGSPIPSVKVDGVTRESGVVRFGDSSVSIHFTADVAAGTHTVALRVDAFGGNAQWVNARVTMWEALAG